jgi:short-subunit dehydrogenase
MKRAIVVGASSGIGKQLAVLLAQNGYQVGITGRRGELLNELKLTAPSNFLVSVFDIIDINKVPEKLTQLFNGLGGLDLLIISSGTGTINPALDGTIEQQTVAVNVTGFTAVADWTFNFFQKQGWGHLVAITSLAGIRGSRQSPAYFASKAYQINYLEGLRQKAVRSQLPIYVTDVRPGFVDTKMAAGENLFWMATVAKASQQIYEAVESKKSVAYVTKRWRLIAFVLRLIPGVLYKWL